MPRSTARISTVAASVAVAAAALGAGGPSVPHAAADTISQPGGSVGSLAGGSSDVVQNLLPAENRLIAVGGSPTGLCQGAVAVRLQGTGYPASATAGWTVAMPGIGPCDLDATLTWHNLTTGGTGERTMTIPEPRIASGPAHPYDAIISTGVGDVEYRLTTTGGASAGPITVHTR